MDVAFHVAQDRALPGSRWHIERIKSRAVAVSAGKDVQRLSVGIERYRAALQQTERPFLYDLPGIARSLAHVPGATIEFTISDYRGARHAVEVHYPSRYLAGRFKREERLIAGPRIDAIHVSSRPSSIAGTRQQDFVTIHGVHEIRDPKTQQRRGIAAIAVDRHYAALLRRLASPTVHVTHKDDKAVFALPQHPRDV